MTWVTVGVAGHFGEFLQGRLGPDGPLALVTVPCPDIGVSVSVRGRGDFRVYQGARTCQPRAAYHQILRALGFPLPARAIVRASTEVGAGAGMSTAALLAMTKGVAMAEGLTLPGPDALAFACRGAEGATDPLMYPRPAERLWASRRGTSLASLPPLPPMEIVGGFCGPPTPTDPEDTRYPDIADLAQDWIAAAAMGDIAALGALSTTSANRTRRLRGRASPLSALAQQLKAVGEVIGHSGAIEAMIFPPGKVPPDTFAACRSAGMRSVRVFRTGGA